MTVAGAAPEVPRDLAGSGEQAGLRVPGRRSRAAAGRPRAHRRLRFLVVGAVILGAVVFLLYQGLSNSIQYFLTANQAVAQRARLGSQTFRLEGTVVAGTVHRVPGGVDFRVASGTAKVAVTEQGSPPELFRAGVPVVLVGHFQGRGFVSDQIMVKHSASYVARHPNRVRASDGSSR